VNKLDDDDDIYIEPSQFWIKFLEAHFDFFPKCPEKNPIV